MKTIVLAALLAVTFGCSADSSQAPDSGTTTATAQLRIKYETSWDATLAQGKCTSIRDYRIKFGSLPVGTDFNITQTQDALTAYKTVDGRTYKDADVLHLYTCVKSTTSSTSVQEFGRLGTDLPLAPGKKYTLSLGGAAATLAEDP